MRIHECTFYLRISVVFAFFLCIPPVVGSEIFLLEDFESYQPGSNWQTLSDTEVINNCDLAGLEEVSGPNQCLRLSYRPSAVGSARQVRRLDIPKSDHYMLTFDVLFEDGFEFVKGGKLPGLGPQEPTTGCDPVASQGWSVRLMWRARGFFQNYIYSQDRLKACGTGEMSVEPVFETEKWYRIEIVTKLNSEKDSFDGFVVTKVNGEVLADDRGLRLRGDTSEETLISKFMFSTFFGGADPSWAPSKTVYARFDNINARPLSPHNDPEVAAQLESEYALPIPGPGAPKSVRGAGGAQAKILMEQDFDSLEAVSDNGSWKLLHPGTLWTRGFSEGRVALMDDILGDGQALKVAFPLADAGSNNSGLRWQLSLDETSQALQLSYDLFFEEGFDFSGRGILPGIGRKETEISELWYVYLSWDVNGVLTYVGRSLQDYVHYDLVYEGQVFQLRPNTHYKVRLSVLANDPGKRNGAVEVWINDQKIGFINRQDFSPNSEHMDIREVFFDTYSLQATQGNSANAGMQYMWLDNIRLTRP